MKESREKVRFIDADGLWLNFIIAKEGEFGWKSWCLVTVIMILDAFEDTEEFSFLEDEDIDLSSWVIII